MWKSEKLKEQIRTFGAFLKESQNQRKIRRIIAVFLLLIVLLAVKSMVDGKRYIVDKKGHVVGVIRENRKQEESFPLTIRYRENDRWVSREVMLDLPQIRKDSVDAKAPEEPVRDLVRDLLDEISSSRKKKVYLPDTLPDGSEIYWQRGGNSRLPVLIILPGLLILAMYADQKKKQREEVKLIEEDIRRNLPGFCNQLTMPMDCGLIVPDAICRIADGYRKQESHWHFRRMILDVVVRSDREERSMTSLMNEYAEKIHVREWTRIVNLLTENQMLGIDLRSKLRAEGEILWAQRKKLAEEKGKLAETRMTMPLAVLLMVLIMITAAPAVLHVKGV